MILMENNLGKLINKLQNNTVVRRTSELVNKISNYKDNKLESVTQTNKHIANIDKVIVTDENGNTSLLPHNPNLTNKGLIVSDYVDSVDALPTNEIIEDKKITPKAPPKPPKLELNGEPQPKNIKLKWNKVNNVQKYILQRSETETGGYTTLITQPGLLYTDTTAKNGKDYWYTVTSVAGGLKSKPSNKIKTKTIILPPTLNTPTTTPGKITLTWNKPIGTTGGYRIYSYKGTENNFQLKQTVTNPGTLTWEDTVQNNVPYYYRITAFDIDYESERSNIVTATAKLLTPTLSVSNVTSSGYTLNWNKSVGATGYRIRNQGGAIVATTGDTNTFTFSGLSATKYYNTVSAFDATDESPTSNQVESWIRLLPPTLQSVNEAPVNVHTATWTHPANSGDFIEYLLFYQEEGGGVNQLPAQYKPTTQSEGYNITFRSTVTWWLTASNRIETTQSNSIVSQAKDPTASITSSSWTLDSNGSLFVHLTWSFTGSPTSFTLRASTGASQPNIPVNPPDGSFLVATSIGHPADVYLVPVRNGVEYPASNPVTYFPPGVDSFTAVKGSSFNHVVLRVSARWGSVASPPAPQTIIQREISQGSNTFTNIVIFDTYNTPVIEDFFDVSSYNTYVLYKVILLSSGQFIVASSVVYNIQY